MNTERWTAIVVVAIGLGLAACGGSSSKGQSISSTTAASPSSTAASATSTSPAGGTAILIKSFRFQPATLAAKVGTVVTVTNNDGTNHTVTAIDGSFDTGAFASGSKTITLSKAGTIAYHCNIHNFMTGTIQVSV